MSGLANLIVDGDGDVWRLKGDEYELLMPSDDDESASLETIRAFYGIDRSVFFDD